MSYDGSSNLTEQLTDLDTAAAWNQTYTGVNLAQIVGGNSLYVGFTGSDGGLASSQTISNFVFMNSSITGSNILPASGPVRIGSGVTLDMSGVSQTIASLADNTPGSGGSIINSNTGATSVLTLSPTSGSTTFSGMIQGGGTLGTISLVMSGSGTQVLSGSNSCSGGTTIKSGRLVVDGSLASPVSVNGGTLGGTGNLTSVTVFSGGNLAPGDSLGALSVSGNLILSAGAVMDYELDTPSTSDTIYAGSLTLNSQQISDFHFTPSANFGPGIYPLIAFGSSSGSLGSNTSGTIDGCR